MDGILDTNENPCVLCTGFPHLFLSMLSRIDREESKCGDLTKGYRNLHKVISCALTTNNHRHVLDFTQLNPSLDCKVDILMDLPGDFLLATT